MLVRHLERTAAVLLLLPPQGVACAGLAADGRAIVSRAMAEANNYK